MTKKKTARKRRPTLKQAEENERRWAEAFKKQQAATQRDKKRIASLKDTVNTLRDGMESRQLSGERLMNKISRLEGEIVDLKDQVKTLRSDRYFYRSLFRELHVNIVSADRATSCIENMEDYTVRQVCGDLVFGLNEKAEELEKEKNEREAKQEENTEAQADS